MLCLAVILYCLIYNTSGWITLNLRFLSFTLTSILQMVINVSEEHIAQIFSRLSEVEVICSPGTAPTYQIMWCRNTGYNFSFLDREILKWVQPAVSILIQVMRSSEMVQCHTVCPFARPHYQMKIHHCMLVKKTFLGF